MRKLLAFLRAEVPAVKKAVVAFLVPQAPSLIALVQKNYGALAAFELTALLSTAGVYKTTNTPKA